VGVTMLSKCANPDCAERFHSLRRGRLFVMDTAAKARGGATLPARRSAKKLEYFWLCDNCCRFRRVVADVNDRIAVVCI